jgi:hypothetical protein
LPAPISSGRRMLTGTIAFSGAWGDSPWRRARARSAPAATAKPTSLSVPPPARAARNAAQGAR